MTLSLTLQEFYHVFSQLNTDQQESTRLEAAISILDTMEGVLAIAETLSCVMVCSVTAGHRGCSQQEEVWPRDLANSSWT